MRSASPPVSAETLYNAPSMFIDLNCDLGEGVGAESALLPLVTSANVSCGAHAGTEADIRRTLELARDHGVVVGAHPGHPDPEHFGRRELPTPVALLRGQITEQVERLRSLAANAGVAVRYLKPHGGLYHQACREPDHAEVLIEIANRFRLTLVGLPGSALDEQSQNRVPFAAEGYADRGYRPDGTLVPRDQPGAFVQDVTEAVEQVRRLAGKLRVRTVCVHGDNAKALEFVKAVRRDLLGFGVELRAFA